MYKWSKPNSIFYKILTYQNYFFLFDCVGFFLSNTEVFTDYDFF